MIDRLITFSIHNKLAIGLGVAVMIAWGLYGLRQIPIDAVPDITTNQVQVITQSPTLAAQEVEQFVTFPIEVALANLPDVTEVRSISRFGISVVTVVFEEHTNIHLARQLISEQLTLAQAEIPKGFGEPGLGPITSGLGEVYQYVLYAAPGYEDKYSDMDLRTINDWIVKRQLAGTPGVIEVSGWGGHLKQYEVAVDPQVLHNYNISLSDVFHALQANNENTGGSYIEKRFNTYFIRGDGLVRHLDDLRNIVVRTLDGVPILIRDIAEVGFGSAPRYGALTYNGQGEVVGGQALMLKGENAYKVVGAIKERMKSVRKSLPEGVELEVYIDRSELIGRAIKTVVINLAEGGLIVILVLVLLLGNLRGGMIVASVIPLAMLFALGMMHTFGVSANLMSLGAIDFGLVVDGSVIIVEAILFRLHGRTNTAKLSRGEMDLEVGKAASRIRGSAAYGEIIILIVYLPILALVGIEGKMFRPMAQTVSFAILGALILSMTYVPMMSALCLQRSIKTKDSPSDRFIQWLQARYQPLLALALKRKVLVLGLSLAMLAGSLFTFNRLGGEFIPVLEEGDFALHQILPPGSSLQQSIEVSGKIQSTLLEEFPEIETVVSKIGTSEIPTDPMPIEVGDIMVRMRPKSEWVSASSKEEMFEKMAVALSAIPGVAYEFTQPIQMRFNELIAGVREDIAIKIFGENTEVLQSLGEQAEKLIGQIRGVGDLRLEQTQGLPQIVVDYDRERLAQYGLNIRDLNTALRTAFAGETAGVVFEGERRFDLVVRFQQKFRQELTDVQNLLVPLPGGGQIPIREVAEIAFKDGPMQISREGAQRRIVIGVNARNRDMESLVDEIRNTLDEELKLPPGYYIRYGGQFQNMVEARQRLSLAVPVALVLIWILLFFTFRSMRQALLIFTAIPMAAIGGVFALWIRDMPFSISAGVGFIALFGVAVLNGIVMIGYMNQLRRENPNMPLRDCILQAASVRLRPVLMTASVAAFGFLPMALSGSAGAEVQRPLATVVIGGLISATLLTMFVLPILYQLFERRVGPKPQALLVAFCLAVPASGLHAQTGITADQSVELALKKHPLAAAADLAVERQRAQGAMVIDLPPTSFELSAGELNGFDYDTEWQISQQFRFPTAYISRSRLQRSLLNMAEVQRTQQRALLEWQVRRDWWDLAYHAALAELYAEFGKELERFAHAAQLRFEAGESNLLEKVNAESQWKQWQLEEQRNLAEWKQSELRLQQWLPDTTAITIAATQFVPLVQAHQLPDSASPYRVQLAMAEENVAHKELRVAAANYLPTWSIGYGRKQIDLVPGFSAVHLGIQIPLFFHTTQGQVRSARLAQDIREAQTAAIQREMQSQLSAARLQIEYLTTELAWYDTWGAASVAELRRSARGAFEAGEIDYIEFIHTLNSAIDLRKNHLRTIRSYNLAVLEYAYLTASF